MDTDPTKWLPKCPGKMCTDWSTSGTDHFNPGDLVMNLTQVVLKYDCIWGQNDYSRSEIKND